MPGRDEAPSVDTGGRSDEAMLFSSAGYAVVVPDYVGLGRGPGPHPYLQAATEASAGVDLLRAARSAATALGRSLDPKVLVAGFSQGGQGATALSKALATGQGAPFGLRATAAVSGVYALQDREIPALLEGRLDPIGGVFNLSYLLVAWNRIYHLYDDPARVFRAPYDTTVQALYDGSRSEDAIFPELPGTLPELLTPEGIDLLAHPGDALAGALRENDATCSGWTSETPVRLYASDGDEVAAASNARQCADQLESSGVDVTVTPLAGAPRHFPSEVAGLELALAWFTADHPPAR
jgi:predicted esterase